METFDYLEELDEWAARVEARHNFPEPWEVADE